MGWLPDHIWEKQRQERKGKGKGKSSWSSGGGSWGGGGKSWGRDNSWSGGKSWGKGGGKSRGKSMKDFPVEQRVWIGGLPADIDWKKLQEHMEQAGKTKWVEAFAWKGKGTGAAAYSTPDEATYAIQHLNGSVVGGKAIQVDVWTKTEDK
eukprot:TRINITY_DN403_c2_g1_i1.p1 TRINITY_DN403_c2_g1~~TRINITY_DN403_c2_g1_i1.p1  ORF type:complete len:150 (-),score=48.43 TRINITY_DN403_c2_g1_i1:190-639(-)